MIPLILLAVVIYFGPVLRHLVRVSRAEDARLADAATAEWARDKQIENDPETEQRLRARKTVIEVGK